MNAVADRRNLPVVGEVTIVAGDAGLRMLAFTGQGDTCIEAPAGVSSLTNVAFAQVEAYLSGQRQTFDFPVDLRGCSTFTLRVLEVCRHIPWGATTTYRGCAQALGSSGAVRAVGSALGRNPLPIIIPCHRVLATGGLGGYTPGVALKRLLLAIEGHADDTASIASAAAIPAN